MCIRDRDSGLPHSVDTGKYIDVRTQVPGNIVPMPPSVYFDTLDVIGSVSYTHLDVYKRQCSSIVITAVYILRRVGKILDGTCTNKHHLTLSDATWDERTAVIILIDRKSTRLNSSHSDRTRMPSSA